jgi:hypothetical protein
MLEVRGPSALVRPLVFAHSEVRAKLGEAEAALRSCGQDGIFFTFL